jgi:hypothetical protein
MSYILLPIPCRFLSLRGLSRVLKRVLTVFVEILEVFQLAQRHSRRDDGREMTRMADLGGIRLMASAIGPFSEIGPHRVVIFDIIYISLRLNLLIRSTLGGHYDFPRK